MIGSETLIFPDAGAGFLRALQTAAFYSGRVRALALLWPDPMRKVLALIEPARDRIEARRLASHLEWTFSARPTLDVLIAEGLLLALDPLAEGSWRQLETGSLEAFLSRASEPEWERQLPHIQKAYDLHFPCFSDTEFFLYCARAVDDPDLASGMPSNEVVSQVLFYRYLLRLAVIAEQTGIPCVSWSPEFQNALWAVRKLYGIGPAVESRIGARGAISAALGHTILDRRLPAIDDLPVEVMLRIREKRRSELESFRVALRELATKVDPSLPPSDQTAAVEDLVASAVDPAVDSLSTLVRNYGDVLSCGPEPHGRREEGRAKTSAYLRNGVLRRSVRASRWEAVKKLGRSSASVASGALSASIALSAGAPLDLGLALGTIGGLAGAVLEEVIDRKRLVHGSQWGILLQLPSRSGDAPNEALERLR